MQKLNADSKKRTSGEISRIKTKIVRTLKAKGVVRAGIFGSYARGKQRKNSDIDILVKINKDLSLLDIVRIKQDLEGRLGKKVDLVEYNTIKPSIKDRVLNEEVRIL